MAKKENRSGKSAGLRVVSAPVLAYRPPRPKRYNPGIALIGCGGITACHLTAYKSMGLRVLALCDPDLGKAEARRKEFFPGAATFSDFREVLKRDDIEVVDIATHPRPREVLIPAALNAGKHVLSQKPFVLDLDKGKRFVELAEKKRVALAVNQNGRWAPHFSYMRQAVAKGLLGDVFSVHMGVHWDHEWIKGTHFENVHHIILYDFAIHWFDMLGCLMQGRSAKQVFATIAKANHQACKPPLLGQALVEYEGGQASLCFDGAIRSGPLNTTYVGGTKGSIRSTGPSLTEQTVTLIRGANQSSPALQGQWFKEGFMGSMGELLCAIEEKRAPINNAAENLRSLALCFAAVASAESGRQEQIGKIKRVPLKSCGVK